MTNIKKMIRKKIPIGKNFINNCKKQKESNLDNIEFISIILIIFIIILTIKMYLPIGFLFMLALTLGFFSKVGGLIQERSYLLTIFQGVRV